MKPGYGSSSERRLDFQKPRRYPPWKLGSGAASRGRSQRIRGGGARDKSHRRSSGVAGDETFYREDSVMEKQRLQWTRVATLGDVPMGEAKAIRLGEGRSVALFN